jgi:hypothetical protein
MYRRKRSTLRKVSKREYQAFSALCKDIPFFLDLETDFRCMLCSRVYTGKGMTEEGSFPSQSEEQM